MFSVRRHGAPTRRSEDLYHALLASSWRRLIALTLLGYTLTNAAFATLYASQPASVSHASTWVDHFFFSVQTMATIGYGVMAPATPWAHVLVTLEALLGMLGVAMASGLFFAKFATPRANVLFSRVAVVSPHEGVPTVKFRVANARGNRIVEAQVRLSLLRDHVTVEGERLRRFEDLPLVRASTPMLALSWTVMHAVEGDSPFARMDEAALRACNAELLITLTGIDETFGQTVHARWGYTMDDLRWGARFVDVMRREEDGTMVLELGRFHEVEG
jgi:inward rectifier potassium channel